MRREHLITSVLADDTRFSIYRSIAEQPGDAVTVADVAERFDVHPNVARMHLGKLARAGLLQTTLRRHSGGGRPAKLYRLADRVATFAFPPRHYELLAALALDVLAERPDEELIRRVCRRAGQRLADEYRRDRRIDGPLRGHALAAAMQDIAEEQGLLPDVEWHGGALRIEIRNCVFREAAVEHPDLSCTLHRAFVDGVIAGLTDDRDPQGLVADGPSLGRGGERCRLSYSRAAQRPARVSETGGPS